MESTQKTTKNMFHKKVNNLKSFFFVRYKNMSKSTLPDPFSCGRKTRKDRSVDDFCDSWDVGLEEPEMRKNEAVIAMSLKEQLKEEDECSPVKNMKENGGTEEKMKSICSKSSKYALEQKMKELEMIDVGDMEHVLDVEEALHYYSRLKSPVYLSIVDKFFTDMYSEFSDPLASASIDGSRRRFGSARINGSKRRFGSIRL